jgi:hypothetical protein
LKTQGLDGRKVDEFEWLGPEKQDEEQSFMCSSIYVPVRTPTQYSSIFVQ